MLFSDAHHFEINGGEFNDVHGDYNQQINFHGDSDASRGRVHSAMKDHIHPDAFHNSSARRDPSRCYPGTREAVIRTISGWIGNPASHCLWMYGPAGTGKSAIAQTMAELCDRDQTLGGAYFFTTGTTGGLTALIPTLAYQLILVVAGLDDHLWAVIHDDRTVLQRSIREQLDKLIVQPFRRLSRQIAPIAIIIDGLDECDSITAQVDLVQLILGVAVHSLPLRFLITSRPGPELRRTFESCSGLSSVSLQLDESLDPNRDIRHFLRNEFERIYRQSVEVGMPAASQLPWPSTEVINELVNKSSGHFIYPATVIKFLQEEHTHPMEQLDAVLKIPGESTSYSTIHANAFQDLDRLYLHILRKYRDRTELATILHAIMRFGYHATAGHLEAIFGLTPGRVCIMLGGLHSLIGVPEAPGVLRFLHASFNNFLEDPERSHEFHFETIHFNTELACGYMRLILAFSPAKSGYALNMAVLYLGDCLQSLRARGGLSTALGRLIGIVSQGLGYTLPCLLYSTLDFLLRTIKEFPEAGAERKACETLLRGVELQLAGLSDTIFTLVRVLGANLSLRGPPLSPEAVGQLIGVPNGAGIIQQTLGLGYADLTNITYTWDNQPIRQIQSSLSRWLSVHRQPRKAWGFVNPIFQGILGPRKRTVMTVEKYTWAWAWDTVASQHPSDREEYIVHRLDLLFCCFRTLVLEFDQPLHPTPLTKQIFKHASESPESYVNIPDLFRPINPIIFEALSEIDFTCILQALPTLSAECYPRLFYLHHALDKLYWNRIPDIYLADEILCPQHHIGFLQNLYSHLLQDPIALHTVPVIYAMFQKLPPRSVELLLGLAPGELSNSVAMQALFGIGVGVDRDVSLRVPASLAVLLKGGLVKLQPDRHNNDSEIDGNNTINDINDRMRTAHEHLGIACAAYLASCDGPECDSDSGPGRHARAYATAYWESHMNYKLDSEHRFETLSDLPSVSFFDQFSLLKDPVTLHTPWGVSALF